MSCINIQHRNGFSVWSSESVLDVLNPFGLNVPKVGEIGGQLLLRDVGVVPGRRYIAIAKEEEEQNVFIRLH